MRCNIQSSCHFVNGCSVHSRFNLQVPKTCPNVDSKILMPNKTWFLGQHLLQFDQPRLRLRLWLPAYHLHPFAIILLSWCIIATHTASTPLLPFKIMSCYEISLVFVCSLYTTLPSSSSSVVSVLLWMTSGFLVSLLLLPHFCHENIAFREWMQLCLSSCLKDSKARFCCKLLCNIVRFGEMVTLRSDQAEFEKMSAKLSHLFKAGLGHGLKRKATHQ